MSKFYLTLHRINPCQVNSLTLSNMNDTPGQIQLFLSLFSIQQFTYLESLQIIQPLNSISMNKILMDLLKLKYLQSLTIIHCKPSSFNEETFLIFSSLINNSTSLCRLYLSGALNTLFYYKITSSINYLYFNNNIFNTITLKHIFSRIPHLKSLNTALTLHMDYSQLLLPIYLKRLTMTIFIDMTNADLKILLNKMTSLKILKLTANGKQWFNGNFWEHCLPINVETFQFNFCTQSIHINRELILETFQTTYWLDLKHWYVMLDCQMNPTMTHIYSLPYCDSQFYYRPSMNSLYRFYSSVPLKKIYLNNVQKLTIDFSTLIAESNSLLTSPHYFANVSSLILVDSECYTSVKLFLKFLESIIDLTRIVELKIGQLHHPNFISMLYNRLPNLYSIRITEKIFSKLRMLDFHRIRNLNICDRLTDVNRMISMFPSIKYICVNVIKFEQMQQVIRLLGETLINITFRQINEELEDKIIKWLYEYYNEHRQFSYDIDEHRSLHIWLSDLSV